MSERKWTLQSAKSLVKAHHPKAVCRFGWYPKGGVHFEYYKINTSLCAERFGMSTGSATISSEMRTAREAWISAAEKIIQLHEVSR